jgi:hypothetical protein
MEQGDQIGSSGTQKVEAVCHEIAAAFRGTPRPARYARWEVYEDDAERLNYLVNKDWSDIASDLNYLTLHSFDEFIDMSEECFYYFLPGYLVGALTHSLTFVDRLADSICRVLCPSEEGTRANELASYLSTKLTPAQRNALTHWLKLEREREREIRGQTGSVSEIEAPQSN